MNDRQLSAGALRRLRLVMSWSTTTKAVYMGMGRVMAYPTAEAQEAAQRELCQRLEAAERGEPFEQDRWVLDPPQRVDTNAGEELAMNSPLMKTLLVIALRHIAPLLGGAGVMSEDDFQQVAGALILLGSIAYHVYQRHQGKKLAGEA